MGKGDLAFFGHERFSQRREVFDFKRGSGFRRAGGGNFADVRLRVQRIFRFERRNVDFDIAQFLDDVNVADIKFEVAHDFIGRIFCLVAHVDEQNIAGGDIVVSGDKQIEIELEIRPGIRRHVAEIRLHVLARIFGRPLMIKRSRPAVFEINAHDEFIVTFFLQRFNFFLGNTRDQAQSGIFIESIFRIFRHAGNVKNVYSARFRIAALQRIAVIRNGADARSRKLARLKVLDLPFCRGVSHDKFAHGFFADVAGRVGRRGDDSICAFFLHRKRGGHRSDDLRVAFIKRKRCGEVCIVIIAHFCGRRFDLFPYDIIFFHFAEGHIRMIGIAHLDDSRLRFAALFADVYGICDEIIRHFICREFPADHGYGFAAVRDGVIHGINFTVLVLDVIDGHGVICAVRNRIFFDYVEADEFDLRCATVRKSQRDCQNGEQCTQFFYHHFSPFHFFKSRTICAPPGGSQTWYSFCSSSRIQNSSGYF